VFLKVGMDVRLKGATMSPTHGQRRRAPRLQLIRTTSCAPHPGRPDLRQAQEHQGQHAGGDHVELVPGDKVDVIVAAKGGGSENKSKFAMLNPSDSSSTGC
jgi:fumarate hydratase class I